MEPHPSIVESPVADSATKIADLEAVVHRLQAELKERKDVEEKLRDLIAALELQLSHSVGETAACKEELTHRKHALELVTEELESLSYSISHDLRAPLRHVLGFSSVLLEDYGERLDASGRNYLDCIVRGSRKMELQIEALLQLSRIGRQDYRPTTVDLSELSRQCAASLKESSPERKVDIVIADKLSVRADAVLLRTAVQSLWDNAWKYTGKREHAIIEFGRVLDGERSVFYLRDNGVGFDTRYADRLFGPFQRMHREGEFEGVGIGLATVQRIINRHGGKIWADAAVDAGATFFFTLPE